MFINEKIQRIVWLAMVTAAVALVVIPESAQAITMSDITVVAPVQGEEGVKQVTVNANCGRVTLGQVAKLMGSDPELVAAMNDKTVNSALGSGEQVIMPSRGWLDHIVRHGDTLWGLAQTYGISVEEIIAENELGNSTLLVPGQKLEIPVLEAKAVLAPTVKDEQKSASGGQTVTTTSGAKKNQGEVAPKNQDIQDESPVTEEEDNTRLAELPRQELGRIGWPLRGYISSRFGPRKERVHEGVDIAAPDGDYIRAALPGLVVFAGPRGTYGNAVILKHASGVRTLYAHASRLMVNQGETVTSGQPIARVGSTGHSTGPHLHFEVLFHGLPLNPLEFLP